MKTAAKVIKPLAYYYGILDKKFQELYFEELYEVDFPVTIHTDNSIGPSWISELFRDIILGSTTT
ncbi:hypothetical protein V7149_16900 [Bacillus sp. JJ1503]|uniref:hypothetical protein n=1 Tax=Bacillus sp. JJ1503 TaxID=3122956 RepID=UPI0030001660